MKNSQQLKRICSCVFVVMVVHVAGAVMINWMYNIITEHNVSHPLSQLAHIFFYFPVWVGIELYRQTLRILGTKDWKIRVGSLLVLIVIILVSASLILMNLWALEYGLMPFLGSLLTSLFMDCWFCIPSIVIAYLFSLIIRL